MFCKESVWAFDRLAACSRALLGTAKAKALLTLDLQRTLTMSGNPSRRKRLPVNNLKLLLAALELETALLGLV